jgi:hypothetical protein
VHICSNPNLTRVVSRGSDRVDIRGDISSNTCVALTSSGQ